MKVFLKVLKINKIYNWIKVIQYMQILMKINIKEEIK